MQVVGRVNRYAVVVAYDCDTPSELTGQSARHSSKVLGMGLNLQRKEGSNTFCHVKVYTLIGRKVS